MSIQGNILPAINQTIQGVTEKTRAHPDDFNPVLKPLLDNDVTLQAKLEEFKPEIQGLVHDVMALAFEVALNHEMTDLGMKHVFIDTIKSVDSVQIIEGMYGNGKVFI